MSAQQKMNSSDLLSMEPSVLQDYLTDNFSIQIPLAIVTVADLEAASRVLSQAYSYYSFLVSMKMAARVQKRELQAQKESKKEITLMLSREETFEAQAAIAKQAYDTVSRMVTIKQQINQEMKML